MLWLSAMPRRLLLLALTSAACFSDDPPQLTATVTSESSSSDTQDLPPSTSTTEAPTTSTTTGTTDPVEPTTADAPTTGNDTFGGPTIDLCKFADPVCPGPPTGEPLGSFEPLDRCNFALARAPEWSIFIPLVEQLTYTLPTATIADVVHDLNAAAAVVPGVPGDVAELELAFRWDDEDFTKYWWTPHGLTGSADALPGGLLEGRNVLLVAWQFEQDLIMSPSDKGVRVTLVDVTDPSDISFRHILLVEPVSGDPVDFKPVAIEASGIAWYRDILYVADENQGLRVFDLSRLLVVNDSLDQVGYDQKAGDYFGGLYAYVAPQIGAYQHISACGPRFSTLALDRTSDPPELVVAEYCDGLIACDSPEVGRVFTWPLDPNTGRLLAKDITYASSAAYTGRSYLRGAARGDGTFFLTSRAPDLDPGELHVVPAAGPGVVYGWADTPGAVMLAGGWIWSLSQKSGARYVFAAPRDAYE